MRLLYIADSLIPSRYANSIQVMNMCHALAEIGFRVDLLVPNNGRHGSSARAFDEYGLRPNFEIYGVPVFGLGVRGRGLVMARAANAWIANAAKRGDVYDFFYSRNPWVCLLLRKGKVFFESHFLGNSFFDVSSLLMSTVIRRAINQGNLRRVVAISRGLAAKWTAAGVSRQHIVVLPDAVSVEKFKLGVPQSVAQQRIGFGPERPIALFAGQLFADRGSRIILEVSRLVPEVSFVLVGGIDRDITRLHRLVKKRGLNNVRIVGYVAHSDIPWYLAAADLLLMPYSGSWRYAEVASPLKLFEYLAAERPIIASDVVAVREVLEHGKNALLVTPDDATSLAMAIRKLLSDSALRRELINGAKKLISRRTWMNRAQAIHDLLVSEIGEQGHFSASTTVV